MKFHLHPHNFKMEQYFTGNYHASGRDPAHIAVDCFECENADKFGRILGLTTSIDRIYVPNISVYHLAFLIQCELVLKRSVIYVAKEVNVLSDSDYDKVARYNDGLFKYAPSINSNLVYHVKPDAELNIILDSDYTIIIADPSTGISKLFAGAKRIISRHPITKEYTYMDHLKVPFRSYDIYGRVKSYLSEHPDTWMKRTDVLVKTMIPDHDKYNTACFRLHDIPLVYSDSDCISGCIYVKKVGRLLYFMYKK